MPHFCSCGGDSVICQCCGRVVCSRCGQIEWRKDLKPISGNVCKECLVTLDEDALYFRVKGHPSLHQRIYPDAADVGIVIDERTKIEARQHIERLLKKYKFTVKTWGDRKANKCWGSTTRIELDSKRILEVTYNKDASRKVEFLVVDQSWFPLEKSL